MIDLWPHSAPIANVRGQSTYWNDAAVRLAETLWPGSIPVWTLVRGTSLVAISGDVLIATDTKELDVLALAEVGLRICRLPLHVTTILRLAGVPLVELAPETAHERLLVRTVDISPRNPIDPIICRHALSSSTSSLSRKLEMLPVGLYWNICCRPIPSTTLLGYH